MSNDFGEIFPMLNKTEYVLNGALVHPIGADRTQKVPTRWPNRPSRKGFSYENQNATRLA